MCTVPGVFGAYRNGKYDFSGKGDYYAELGSQIKSESWLGGAYYKFGRNNWKLLTTLYAGKQDMDVKTDDRLAFASTDAMQYGASAELVKKIAVAQYLNVEPSLGIRYTVLDIDDLIWKRNLELNLSICFATTAVPTACMPNRA